MIDKSNLILINFPTFIKLEKGDQIYVIKHNFYSGIDTIEKCKIIYAQWHFSGVDCVSKKTHKSFYYLQIIFTDSENKKWYCDSAGKNYHDIYIDNKLFNELKNRKRHK